MDYRDDKKTESLLKEALDVWNSLGGANLVYAGRKDLSFLAGDCGESAAQGGRLQEAIYVTALAVPNTEFCVDDETAGITYSYYSYLEDLRNPVVFISFAAIFVSPEVLYDNFEIGLSVMVHEIGHALGLGHPFDYNEPDTYSVMNYYGRGTTLPTTSDKELISYLYGRSPIRYVPPRLFYYRYAAMDYTPFGRETLCLIGGYGALSFSGLIKSRFLDHELCYEVQDENLEIITRGGDICTFTSINFDAGKNLCKNAKRITSSIGMVERWLAPQDVSAAMFSVGEAGDDGRLEPGERIHLVLQVPPVQERTTVLAGFLLPDGVIYLLTPEGFVPYSGQIEPIAVLDPGEFLEKVVLSFFPVESIPSGIYLLFTYLASLEDETNYIFEWYTLTR